LRTGIPRVAQQRGVLPERQGGGLGYRGRDDSYLSDRDYGRVQDILWDLIIEGIVRPGLGDGANDSFPFFHVTEWGKAKLTAGHDSPYDPDGYLKRLNTAVPGLDPVIATYLQESLHTFRIGCLLSSTIALGCASEKAFLLLVKAYGDALTGTAQKKFRENTEAKMIKRQFDEFSRRAASHLRPLLPADVEADLDVTLSGIFTLLRNLRNEAGHPTGTSVDREQAYANLLLFPTYLKKVYLLMSWLAENAPLT
jgi:hypothetical protein